MKTSLKIISLSLCLCLLCSCTRTKYVPIEEHNTEKSSEKSIPNPSEVLPEPMAESKKTQLSAEKKAHSYGIAKNGEAHEISKNAQKYFNEKGFNAFCLDTKSQNKVLYLTFDCGYENGYTSKILDVLKEKNVSSAFFCTLPQVKENPDLIKRMIDEGHIVGNHSVTHPSFAEITEAQMTEEIQTMDNYLRENFNYSEPFFRFPKGEYNEVALNTVGSLGYKSVFWSLSYADWDLNKQKGEQYAYETVISRLHPGAVILLHSVSPDNANALSRIIDKAREEGYSFASLRDFPLI